MHERVGAIFDPCWEDDLYFAFGGTMMRAWRVSPDSIVDPVFSLLVCLFRVFDLSHCLDCRLLSYLDSIMTDLHTTLSSAQAGPSRPNLAHSPSSLSLVTPEIIIVGAGVVGTALAYSLSKTRSVLLLERDLSEPDRIVGELLQPGGIAALQQLGLEDVLDGIDAVPVEGYCVVSGDRQVGIPYPALEAMAGEGEGDQHSIADKLENGNAHANGYTNGDAKAPTSADIASKWHVPSSSGKKEGRSFHHGRLISSLRSACFSRAAEPDSKLTILEATVRDLVYCEHTDRVIGVSAAFKTKPPSAPGQEQEQDTTVETVVRKVYAPVTIIADGCFSKFRTTRGARIPTPKTRSHFVGIVLKDVDLPINHMGTVCLTPNGPVLLYQIADEARETRMLVDVKGKLPSLADGSLKDYIIERYVPHLPSKLQEPIIQTLSTQRLRTMPNSFLPPSLQGSSSSNPFVSSSKPSLSGAILVGDAYNMRHPLTGGGMTVAFNDAVLLTEYLSRLPPGRDGLQDWSAISTLLGEWFWERKKMAGVVNVLSMALYDLFGGADEPDLEILREGCFRYFELGGDRVAGPVGLLSALTPKPLVLFYHFFSVAFYSIYILLKDGPPPRSGEKVIKPSWIEVPGLLLFSIRVFWTACIVLLPVIWTEFKL
ncbi:squalene epoxidase-domain-containing protein [Naematelia encephala]|uniref:squalene monooxygenase n=1 Tax=Naematelia encephala TaxID=71784 RepID=A0A1Y2AZF0_9TREE|nr:squalene epoxidase-domain-containing protein [Naematelia encephala]